MYRNIVQEIKKPVELSKEGEVKTPVYRFLDTVGDGSGTKNANGNYSLGEERFLIKPAADEVIRLERMIVTIEDTAGFTAAKYGDIAALTTGVDIKFVRDGVDILSYTDNELITTNARWASFCYDADLKTWGAGNELLAVRWTFSKSGTPVRLVGSEVESFEIVLNDDLSGLVLHKFHVQGYYE